MNQLLSLRGGIQNIQADVAIFSHIGGLPRRLDLLFGSSQ
jgi:hypothetical protein